MNKKPPQAQPRNTHPDKDYFRQLIENETDPNKRKQLQEEEAAHNHPNRDREEE